MENRRVSQQASAADEPSYEEKLAVLKETARRRGYYHHHHRLLANYDLNVLREVNGVVGVTYLDHRELDIRTKELVQTVNTCIARYPHYIIGSHIRKSMKAGVTAREMLEAIEIVMFEAGRTTFENALLAWREAIEDSEQETTIMNDVTKQSAAAVPPVGPTTYQKILGANDREVCERIDSFRNEVYAKQRTLDPKTKELIHVVILTVLKSPEANIRPHIRRAIQLGASEREVLQVLEAILIPAGMATFEVGLLAWANEVGAEGLDVEGAMFTKLPSTK